MNAPFYDDIKTTKDYSIFRFVSTGKKGIIKTVEFQKTKIPGVYNLAMGDMIASSIFSDEEISDNGDIKKVLTTVVNIVQIYTRKYPKRKILIQGNTALKTQLYQRIIRMYYDIFIEEFEIDGYIDKITKEIFHHRKNYIAFTIKRK